MSSPSAAPAASTSGPPRRWLAVVSVLLAAAGLATVLIWTDPIRHARTGRGTELPARIHQSTWVLALERGRVTGRADQVSLVAPGIPDVPVATLAIDPVSGGVFAADTSGRLGRLPSQPTTPGGGDFKGLLAGLAALDDGRIAVCLGRSGYGADYLVRLSAGPDAGEREVATGCCTRLLATDGTALFYATKRARLGHIAATGRRDWEIVLPQVPTVLAAGRDGTALVGDDRGGLTLVGPGGVTQTAFMASDLPITAAAFVRHSAAIVTVDRAGVVGWFDRQGRQLGRYGSGAPGERILALVEHDDGLLLVTAHRRLYGLRLPAVLPHWSLPAVEAGRAAAVLFFGAMAAGGIVLSSRRITGALRAWSRRVMAARLAYLLLLPTFLLLGLFCYYPMATALGYSFWRFSLTSPMEFAGFDNFRAMADDPYLRVGAVNMAILVVTGVVKMIVLPLLAAELVFWVASARLQQFFRAAMTFPAVVPGIVMVLVWKMIYDPYNGLLNLLLRAVGLADLQRAWLGDEHSALWAVVGYNFPWINLLIFLIFLGGLLQIDRNIFEAADIDGASVPQRFLHIDLPALRPKLQLALTLIVLWSVQDYASVLILTGGGPGAATYVPALEMFEQISGGQNLGYSSAIGLVLFALVLAITYCTRRFHQEDGS